MMYLIILTYQKPLDIVEQFLTQHRDYLEMGYQKNYLIVSGPKIPREGGILLSQLRDKKVLIDFLQQDPFYLNGIADFEIIEFTPVKYHQDFAGFLTQHD